MTYGPLAPAADFLRSGVGSSPTALEPQDCVETYFECITTCSLDDGECISHCTTQLREAS